MKCVTHAVASTKTQVEDNRSKQSSPTQPTHALRDRDGTRYK